MAVKYVFGKFSVVLILLVSVRIVEGQRVSDSNVCSVVDLNKNVAAACNPCDSKDWLESILHQRSGKTSNGSTCFNTFPLGVHTAEIEPEALTKGKAELPDLSSEETQRGFIITSLPFLRYNTKVVGQASSSQCLSHMCPYSCTATANKTGDGDASENATTATPEDNLDIGGVMKYYVTLESTENNMEEEATEEEEDKHDIDMQLLEWPGRTHSEQIDYLEARVKKQCDSILSTKQKPKHCFHPFPRHFKMLKFQRESSKLLQYPCNKEQGTHVSAFGLMNIRNRDENQDRDEPHNTIYVAFDKTRLFHFHTQPIYVSQYVLDDMAKPEGKGPRGICQKVEPDCTYNDPSEICMARQKYFVDRGEIIFDESACGGKMAEDKEECNNCGMQSLVSDDLRVALDFTFVQGRLIIGMRCGILVVSNFLLNNFNIYAARLLTSEGWHTNTFKPVSKIASNFCCAYSNCRTTIIAAYPAAPKVDLNEFKEIYISFDLGDTFKVKLVTEQNSALSLMWGMYKMYGDWLIYNELLENPDPEDLKSENGEELHPGYIDLRAKPDWNSLTLEEKEKRFLFGESKSAIGNITDLASAKKSALKFIRLRSQGSLGRYVRYRRAAKEVKLDLAPDWLKNEISAIRQNAYWYHKWTDANCDSVPQCRESFENDVAVRYFLRQSDVVVKMPRRPKNEPFCDQIVSLAVLEEEDSLYAICLMGFGDFRPPHRSGKPYCSSRDSDILNEGTSSNSTNKSCLLDLEYPVLNKNLKLEKNASINAEEFEYNPCVNPVKYYAIFTLSVKDKLPLVLLDERRSERLFTCKPLEVPLDWSGCKKLHVQPDIIRVPNSITLLVKNCGDVLYYSPNGGRTLYNTEFYAHYSEAGETKGHGQCDGITKNNNVTTTTPDIGIEGTTPGTPPVSTEEVSTETGVTGAPGSANEDGNNSETMPLPEGPGAQRGHLSIVRLKVFFV